MNSVFLDTVGLLALWDVSDQWHASAEVAFAKLISNRARLISTSFIMIECGNAAARRPYRPAVARFRQELQQSGRLIVPTEDDWNSAWSNYEKGKPGDAGIVDHLSFVVLKRVGVTDVFSNDRHFKAAGFSTMF
jgi:predicted nucleic acid-binding protein